MDKYWKWATASRFRIVVLAAVFGVFVAATAWRYAFVFHWHNPTDYMNGAMNGYAERAMRFANPNYQERVTDIVFPPGGHIFLGIFYKWDRSWKWAVRAQFLLCALTPVLIGAIAYELYGRRVAAVSLVLAGLYYPFIDYAGYFMTESNYLFFVLLAFWLLVRGLRAAGTWAGVASGVLAGIALGVAAAFKTVILPCALLIFCALAFAAWTEKWRRIWMVLASSSLGLLLIVVPLIVRATRINDGRFVPISTNGGLTVLMGHYGKVRVFRFRDRQRRSNYRFSSPVAVQGGYRRRVTFPFGPWDSDKMLRAAWKWSRKNPGEAFTASCQNVLHLFGGTLAFPSVRYPKWKPWLYWYQWVFWLVILLPAAIHFLHKRRELADSVGPGLSDRLLILPFLGLMIVAFFTIGQPRYRYPMDAFLIILAARCYTWGWSRPDGLVPPRATDG